MFRCMNDERVKGCSSQTTGLQMSRMFLLTEKFDIKAQIGSGTYAIPHEIMPWKWKCAQTAACGPAWRLVPSGEEEEEEREGVERKPVPTSLQVQTEVEEGSVSKRAQQVVAAFEGGH